MSWVQIPLYAIDEKGGGVVERICLLNKHTFYVSWVQIPPFPILYSIVILFVYICRDID